MPIDERLRDGMQRSARVAAPDTRANFRRAVVEARRRRRRNALVGTLAAAAGTLALVLAWPQVDSQTQPAVQPPGEVPAASPIDGLYGTRITVADGLAAGLPLEKARLLAGTRQLTISLGTIRMVDPTSFATVPVSGTAIVTPRTVVVDSVGGRIVLGWRLTDSGLTLRVLGGRASPAERAVWSAHAWRSLEG